MAVSTGKVGDDFFDHAELRATLDDEIARLPEKYRRVVVFCYLDGLTHDQAAERLRCPVGTVRSRLSTAREKLQARLLRKGIRVGASVSAGAFATILSVETAKASVPSLLAQSTLSAGMAVMTTGAGTAMAGMVSASAVSLADGVTTTMMITKIKILGALAMVSALTVGVGGTAAMQLSGRGAGTANGAAVGGDDPVEEQIAKLKKEAEVRAKESEQSKLVMLQALNTLQTTVNRLEKENKRLKDHLDQFLENLPDTNIALANRASKDLSEKSVALEAAKVKLTRAKERIKNPNDPTLNRVKQDVEELAKSVEEAEKNVAQARQNAGIPVDQATSNTRGSGFSGMGAAGEGKASAGGSEPFAVGSGTGTTSAKQEQIQVGVGATSFGGISGTTSGGQGMMGAMAGGRGGMQGMAGGMGMMSGGSSSRGVRNTNSQGIEMVTAGDYILIVKRDADEIIASNPETGQTATYTIPKGTEMTPVASSRYVTMEPTGGKFTQLATFVPSTGKWYPIALDSPAQGPLSQTGGTHLICYVVGNRVYAFSALTQTWDVAKLPEGANPNVVSGGSRVTFEQDDRLYVFLAKTGKWTNYENGILIDHKNHLYIFNTKTGKWTNIGAGDVNPPNLNRR